MLQQMTSEPPWSLHIKGLSKKSTGFALISLFAISKKA